MLETRFGIEVEFTGITRAQAAKAAAEFLGGRVESGNDYYNAESYRAGRTGLEIYERRQHPDAEKGARPDCGGGPGIQRGAGKPHTHLPGGH